MRHDSTTHLNHQLLTLPTTATYTHAHAGQVAVKRDPTLQLPYKVDELTGMVGGYAVSLSSSLEDWTRAMKYLLTDVKWLLALVAKYEGSVRA
jgi:hypothetical protein